MKMIAYRNARSRTVTSSSAKFTAAIVPNRQYRIASDVDFWYAFAPADGAAVASANHAIFVFGGKDHYDVPIAADVPMFLHVIRSTVDGTVNIAEMHELESE